jgi:hypothetical protein
MILDFIFQISVRTALLSSFAVGAGYWALSNLHFFLSAGYDVCTTIGSLSKSHISLIGNNDVQFFQNYLCCVKLT